MLACQSADTGADAQIIRSAILAVPALKEAEVTPAVREARADNQRRVRIGFVEKLRAGGEIRPLGVFTRIPIRKGEVVVRAVAASRAPERDNYSIQVCC